MTATERKWKPGDTLKRLEGWLSEEGALTGCRQVHHIEFDQNWKDAFRVVLRVPAEDEKGWIEYEGGGPAQPGGLELAIARALDSVPKEAGKPAPAIRAAVERHK